MSRQAALTRLFVSWIICFPSVQAGALLKITSLQVTTHYENAPSLAKRSELLVLALYCFVIGQKAEPFCKIAIIIGSRKMSQLLSSNGNSDLPRKPYNSFVSFHLKLSCLLVIQLVNPDTNSQPLHCEPPHCWLGIKLFIKVIRGYQIQLLSGSRQSFKIIGPFLKDLTQ